MHIDTNALIHGVFKREVKNRFRCLVEIDGEEELCYVPSSCRLTNFIELNGKEVLLSPNVGENEKTRYALFAVKSGNSYILLNLALANAIVSEQLSRRYFSFLGKRKTLQREVTVSGYKADVYAVDSKTIIEVKTVISDKKEASFPTVYSDRILDQLERIQRLLEEGQRVCWLLVSLSPTVRRIVLNKDSSFFPAFLNCIEKGMLFQGCKLQMRNGEITVASMIDVVW